MPLPYPSPINKLLSSRSVGRLCIDTSSHLQVNTGEAATAVGLSAAAGPDTAAGSTTSAQDSQGSGAASYDKKVENLSGTHVPKTGPYSKSELSERPKTQSHGQTPTQPAGHFFGDASDDEKSVKDDDSQDGGVKLAGHDEGKANLECKQSTGVISDTYIGVRSHTAVTQVVVSHDTPKMTGYTGPTQDDFAKLNSHVASLNLGLSPRPNISFFAEPEPVRPIISLPSSLFNFTSSLLISLHPFLPISDFTSPFRISLHLN